MGWLRRFFRPKKGNTWGDLVRETENDASTEELALLNSMREQAERDTERLRKRLRENGKEGT